MKDRPKIFSYFQLMKPTIMLLVLLTGTTSLVLQKSLLFLPYPEGLFRFLLVLTGLMLTGGSANAFNMYLERELDGRMERTKNKRPLPLGKIKPRNALTYALMIGIIGVAIFVVFFNLLSAMLALATVLFYSFFYTLYLKPRTENNIVIGGMAGAMAPVIAWAAVSGQIAATPLILFMIIFLWTPPHFWALAIHLKKDYEEINYPMMPIVRGDKATKYQILVYSLLLVAFSAACVLIGSGLLYGAIAVAAGAMLLSRAISFVRSHSGTMAHRFFGYSIIYLFAIFAGLILDAVLRFPR